MKRRTTLNISLPTELRLWVDELVGRASYSTASDYIRDLVRKDQKRRLRAIVDAKLLSALESGPALPLGRKEWQSIRQEVRSRVARRTRRRAG